MEKGLEVIDVDIGRSASLRKCEVEEEERFHDIVHWNPGHEPFGNIFNSNDATQYRPVHEPSFQILLRRRSLRKRFITCVTRIKECNHRAYYA
jgi:hypothetical protein